MNKAKTRKTVTKRFKITKTGKVYSKKANTSHLNRKDTVSAKHRKSRNSYAKKGFAKKIKKMIVN